MKLKIVQEGHLFFVLQRGPLNTVFCRRKHFSRTKDDFCEKRGNVTLFNGFLIKSSSCCGEHHSKGAFSFSVLPQPAHIACLCFHFASHHRNHVIFILYRISFFAKTTIIIILLGWHRESTNEIRMRRLEAQQSGIGPKIWFKRTARTHGCWFYKIVKTMEKFEASRYYFVFRDKWYPAFSNTILE